MRPERLAYGGGEGLAILLYRSGVNQCVMGNYSESDSQYMRGRIEGYVDAVIRHSEQDIGFDQDRWRELYGERVIYDGFPAWPSQEARVKDEDQLVLCDWEEATEEKFLKHGVEVPRDRPGTIVFANGTAVVAGEDFAVMIELDDRDTELIERWDELALEMLRDAYDYDPDSR